MSGKWTQGPGFNEQPARPDVPGLEAAYSLSSAEKIDIELDGIAKITSKVFFHSAIRQLLCVLLLAISKIDDGLLLRHRGFPNPFYGFLQS